MYYTNALVQAAGELLREMCMCCQGGLGEPGKQTKRLQDPAQGLQLHHRLTSWRQDGCPGPKHPLGACPGSLAPHEQDLALMANMMCHQSRGGERSVLNSPCLGREAADKD